MLWSVFTHKAVVMAVMSLSRIKKYNSSIFFVQVLIYFKIVCPLSLPINIPFFCMRSTEHEDQTP
jgi:hypothetical protein